MESYKLYINGEWVNSPESDKVIEKYTGKPFATIPIADESMVNDAIAAAEKAQSEMKNLPAYKRAEILESIASKLAERTDEIAKTIAREAGKSWKYALGEATRARETFTFAADVARNMHGETVPMDASSAGVGRLGFWFREPVGVVAAITPFNFPLNLVAHKVAPAIAAGCSIILKPAGTTPITAAILAEIISETDLPKGAFNLIHGSGRKIGKQLVKDPRPQKITFTGSVEVGKWIKENSGLKRVTLELGNNSAVVVDRDANLDLAIERCLMGAFANSGQICISVQRIYLHEDIADEFTNRFVSGTKSLKVENPLVKDSDVGPMIDVGEVDRIQEWINKAEADGATILTGGKKINDRVFEPTVISDTRPDMDISCGEVFAPVVLLETVKSFDEGLAKADDSIFGLQAGVFTNNINRAMDSIRGLNVGGVMINDVPTYRVDHMPYGGNKQSGIGREGVRFAVEEMTQIKMVVING
jgi:acyl-CoA reductase-like NAD-dependent aldehyde dehydrogenase